ncbi:MAG TPA: heavy metal-binding domain-containing protein, partial [Polyangiaceae bacterium]|nr:heavy metal-binding domain-containing protein [Polyangiaceae bacterium]
MNADEPTHQIAPRTLRVMATVRWVLLALVTMLAAYTIWTQWGPDRERHGAHREARFHCPMHPEIRSPDPGECPICHMTLEPIPDERRGSSAASVAPSDGPANTSVITVSDERQQAVGLVTSPVESATLGDRLRVPGVISAP